MDVTLQCRTTASKVQELYVGKNGVWNCVGGYFLTKINVGPTCSLKWLELRRGFLCKEINVMWSFAQNSLKSEQKINSKSATHVCKPPSHTWAGLAWIRLRSSGINLLFLFFLGLFACSEHSETICLLAIVSNLN